MMTKSKQIGMTVLGLVAWIGAQAATQPTKNVWIAKLTGHLSCDDRVVRNSSNLSKVIGELEENRVQVSEVKIARLDGRSFCMSCSCPDGTFNVVKVKDSKRVEEILAQGDWEKVSASEIVPVEAPSVNEEEGELRVLPVNPEI